MFFVNPQCRVTVFGLTFGFGYAVCFMPLCVPIEVLFSHQNMESKKKKSPFTSPFPVLRRGQHFSSASRSRVIAFELTFQKFQDGNILPVCVNVFQECVDAV
jgi:hypothetical protein